MGGGLLEVDFDLVIRVVIERDWSRENCARARGKYQVSRDQSVVSEIEVN